MTVRITLVLALFLWVLAGCRVAGHGADQGVDPAPDPEVTAADSSVRLVDEADADLVLFVSNQSFDDPRAELTVTIDDVTVVDGEFHVEDQHNWIRFPLTLSSPGRHEITATSDSGATLRESFKVPRDKVRYAVIDHWIEDRSADLLWRFQRQPMGFA